MLKMIIGWTCIGIGSLILFAAVFVFGAEVWQNWQLRRQNPIGWSLFRMPDFMGISIVTSDNPDRFRGFFTDARAFLLGEIGLGLVALAVGMHFLHLQQQDAGRRQQEQSGCVFPEPHAGAGETRAR
ncbi:MAG: hypothetical protein WCS01_11770 [bacterium]